MERAEVVIVGAGLSGLMAAAFLSREGRDVVVLEGSSAPGGCLGGFTRRGFAFDGGAQSFEDVQILFPLLKELDLFDELDIERADYRLRSPTIDCPLSLGHETVVDAFCRAHPRHADGLGVFFEEVRRVMQALEEVSSAADAPRLREGWARASTLAKIVLGQPRAVLVAARAQRRTQRAVASQWIDDPDLASFLGTFLYRDASLFHLALFFYAWQQDYWRPRLGVRRLPEVLAARCESQGVKLRYRTTVDEILRINGRVVGVRLEGGDELRSPCVLAACDHVHLARDLLGLPTQAPGPTDVSDAFFSLFLGLDIDDDALDEALPEHHTFFVPEHRDCRIDPTDRDAHRGRWIEVTRSSRGSAGSSPEGCCSLTVQTMTRADWADWWGMGASRGRRTARYEELKAQVEEELLDSLEAFVPGLRAKIRFKLGATPLTYERYTGNVHGASAGWSWDAARATAWQRSGDDLGLLATTRTSIPGLYRCGHWTVDSVGVPGAALSGWAAYRAIRADAHRLNAAL